MESPQPDFSVEGARGSCILVRPLTPRAFEWTNENIANPQRLGNVVAVEQQSMAQVVQRIVADGLVVA